MIRFFDLFFSTVGIILLMPFFLILLIWVKLDSNGPVFYKQLRVGRFNKDFYVFKFRTMHINSDKLGLITIGGRDPRVTNAGYLLRKYKLDELPQLLNVFFGDMSLVGPRPEVRKYVALYNKEQQNILSIRPGITDWASIEYRDENIILEMSNNPEKDYIEIIMPEKILLNNIYVKNYNIIEYFKIIFVTFYRIISPKKLK